MKTLRKRGCLDTAKNQNSSVQLGSRADGVGVSRAGARKSAATSNHRAAPFKFPNVLADPFRRCSERLACRTSRAFRDCRTSRAGRPAATGHQWRRQEADLNASQELEMPVRPKSGCDDRILSFSDQDSLAWLPKSFTRPFGDLHGNHLLRKQSSELLHGRRLLLGQSKRRMPPGERLRSTKLF